MSARRVPVGAIVALALVVALAGCGPRLADVDAPGPLAVAADGLDEQAVRVRNVTCEGIITGSAFALDRHRLITNRHVVAGAKRIEVNLADGSSLTARVESVASRGDIALVAVAADLPVTNPLGHDPSVGDRVRAVGYPGGGRLTVTSGHVRALLPPSSVPDGVARFMFDARVVPGNSGGPVIDDAGKIVGVVVEQRVSDKTGIAIPIDEAHALAAQPATPVKAGC